jgi:glutamate formiminotransferase
VPLPLLLVFKVNFQASKVHKVSKDCRWVSRGYHIVKEITLGIKNKSIKTQNLNSILDLFLGICFGNSLQLHIGSN